MHANPEEKGYWKENSKLDQFDKFISKPIFNLDLGLTFELIATIPGFWFGVPVISLVLWPLLVATLVN